MRWATRAGYLAFLVAIVAFALGFATGFAGPFVGVTIVALATACAVLPVPIILGYGIRAAERDEREGRGGR